MFGLERSVVYGYCVEIYMESVELMKRSAVVMVDKIRSDEYNWET